MKIRMKEFHALRFIIEGKKYNYVHLFEAAGLVLFFALMVLLPGMDVRAEEAAALDARLSSSTGQGLDKLKDSNTETVVPLGAGEKITVSTDSPMQGIYIKWATQPKASWTLTVGGEESTYGEHGYLHEFVDLPEGCTECSITVSEGIKMCDVFAYGPGDLPDKVQKWEPPCEKADFLVFSTHSDDEILFLGGVLVKYAGVQKLKVQVAYMTNYWNAAVIREHEKLDGIWTCGVRNYPVNATFPDEWAKTYEDALKIYNPDEVQGFVVEQIRRFQPQVVVTQDVNGEYGHGGHEMLAQSVMKAVDSSMLDTYHPESVATYGTWDVPKTYLHIWPENTIHMDLHVPLEEFGGQNAVEVAAAAYKRHVSQQWCWFYVSDDEDYDYSIANFGLYRTNVGTDSNNDMMENIVSYAEQEEQERIRLEEEERKKKEEEEARLAAEAEKKAEEERVAAEIEEKTKKKKTALLIIIPTTIVVLIAAFAGLIIVKKRIEEEKKRKRRLARKRRREEELRREGANRGRSDYRDSDNVPDRRAESRSGRGNGSGSANSPGRSSGSKSGNGSGSSSGRSSGSGSGRNSGSRSGIGSGRSSGNSSGRTSGSNSGRTSGSRSGGRNGGGRR